MNYHINAQLMNLGAGEDPYMRRIGGRVEPIAEETGTEYSTTNRLTETQSLVTPSTNK